VVNKTPLPTPLGTRGDIDPLGTIEDLVYSGNRFAPPTQTRTRTGSVFHSTGRESARKTVAETPVINQKSKRSDFMGSSDLLKSQRRKKTTGLALRDLDSSDNGKSYFKNRKKNASEPKLVTSEIDLFADFAMSPAFAMEAADDIVPDRQELRSVIKIDASVKNFSVCVGLLTGYRSRLLYKNTKSRQSLYTLRMTTRLFTSSR
jgi:hypothetical protein